MSIPRTKQYPIDSTELAVTDLHTAVGELRRIGLGTAAALLEIARKLRLGKRWVRHLYYRDEPVLVDAQKQHRIAAGIVRVLDHLSEEHMRYAAVCSRRAAEIRDRQQQLNLPLEETHDAWLGSMKYWPRLAA